MFPTMIPTMPQPVTFGFGYQVLGLDWTVSGALIVLVAIAIAPWVIAGLAAAVQQFSGARRVGAKTRPASSPLRPVASQHKSLGVPRAAA